MNSMSRAMTWACTCYNCWTTMTTANKYPWRTTFVAMASTGAYTWIIIFPLKQDNQKIHICELGATGIKKVN